MESIDLRIPIWLILSSASDRTGEKVDLSKRKNEINFLPALIP